MRLLILGGTGEGRTLALALHRAGHAVTYSLAGRGALPSLPCSVRVGGFGGAEGLADYLYAGGFHGLVDATHPFAAAISRHAAEAARRTCLPLWRWQRPTWEADPGDRWQRFPDALPLLQALAGHRRILFTVGRTAFAWADQRLPGQTWFVRALACPTDLPAYVHCLAARGPFLEEEELALMQRLRVDALVAKDSGGRAVRAKLDAARRLGLPVYLLARPAPPEYGQTVSDLGALLAALEAAQS